MGVEGGRLVVLQSLLTIKNGTKTYFQSNEPIQRFKISIWRSCSLHNVFTYLFHPFLSKERYGQSIFFLTTLLIKVVVVETFNKLIRLKIKSASALFNCQK